MRLSKSVPRLSRLPTLRPSHPQETTLPSETDSLFAYTSGRWLWNEDAQLGARRIKFNLKGLQETVCRAVGAERCTSIEKAGEGNYNKAFRCRTSDGRAVIAKMPHPNAGPARLTTMSEVATMDFARTVLGLPVPKVYDWSATTHNAVQSEFIIMEEARGSQVHSVWSSLPLPRKVDIVKHIVDVEQKMLSISFNQIGSLYFSDCGLPDCTPVHITSAAQGIDTTAQTRFSIGPIVRREFWDKERGQMRQHHGPSTQYFESIASREIDWICEHSRKAQLTARPWQHTSTQQQSQEAHVAALQKFKSAARYIVPRDEDLVKARFWHPDFHGGNVYSDEHGQITSIIDWQGAWTTPTFLGVHPSSLLDYTVDILMKLPDNFKSLDDEAKDKLRYQVAQSIMIHSYETETAHHNPIMYKMMRHPHGQTLKQVEAFANATWDNSLYPLNECLLSIQREWEHFHVDEVCPYSFSANEVAQHQHEVEDFNYSQELWHKLSDFVTSEGYVGNEDFASAVEVFRGLQETALAHLEGKEKALFEATPWVQELRLE